MMWAYGFTAIGATLTAGIGFAIWTLVVSSETAKVPKVDVETSQFRLGQ
jgi:hypothetical protein